MAETIEVLQRGWHIEGQSVRPDHRMVAHTGLPHARTTAGQPDLNTLDLLLVLCGVGSGRRRLPPRVPHPRRLLGGHGPGRDRRLVRAAAGPPAARRRQRAAAPVRHDRDPPRHGVHRPGGGAPHREPSARHAPGGLGAVGRSQRGAVAGVVGVVIAVWVLLPVMVDVPGWFASQARSSAVARIVDDRLPDPPDTFDTLRRLVGEDQFARVFDRPVQAGARPRPPADVDEHPASGGRRGGAVHRQGARRGLPADPGGQRVRGGRRPGGDQRPRRRRRGRDRPAAQRRLRGAGARWSRSIRTATWRC